MGEGTCAAPIILLVKIDFKIWNFILVNFKLPALVAMGDTDHTSNPLVDQHVY